MQQTTTAAIEDGVRRLGQDLPPGAGERLAALLGELGRWNRRINLTAIRDQDAMVAAHVLDSLAARPFLSGPRVADVGTGAGFPGLVVGAMRPHWPVTLVESRRKRSDWLREMRTQLSLPLVRVEARRIETLETFEADVVSARAFAPLPRTLDLARRFSTSDTLWLLPKGRSAAQELSGQPPGLQRLFHVEQSRTDPEGGILLGRGIIRR